MQGFSDSHKGRGAMTMLNQIQNYSGSPAIRFDRWIKLFDNVIAMSNWDNSDTINLLSTKMSGDAYDFLQNIMESGTLEYNKIKALFQENFHGDENADFYQEKFDEMQRKPKENILNYAFRLKTIYQRAYPSNKLETKEEKKTQLQFLRQKFLQGLESELQNIIRYKKVNSFEELVAITQKYAKRVQIDQTDKDKRSFVNAVSIDENSQLIQAIEKQSASINKQSESINAIATSLKFGNKPPDLNIQGNLATNIGINQQLEKLTDTMVNLGSLLQTNIRNDSRNQRPGNHNQNNRPVFSKSAPNSFGRQQSLPPQAPVRPFQYQAQPPRPFPQANQQPPQQQIQRDRQPARPLQVTFQQPISAARTQQMGMRCSNCGLNNHTVETCFRPRPMHCTNCNMTNHNIESCFRTQRLALDNNVCFYCKLEGHRANNCPNRQNAIRIAPPDSSLTQGNA